jgi:glucose/arabinose dehydrogenase
MYITPIVLFSSLLTQPLLFEPMHASLQFNEPVQVVFDGTTDEYLYVVEKEGTVRRVSTSEEEQGKPIFLDIRERVSVRHSEEGLLSLAFHPNYEVSKEIFVWYTAQEPRRCVLSKFTNEEPETPVDTSTEEVLLEVAQPWGNHNGGTVMFGKDGYLYVGIGDGGASNDPHENGQNKKTLLASIIRIDPSNKANGKNYSVPPDNPFVDDESARPEIWATGLRNPWRMSFDRETGELWVGDVGQNKWEEVDIVLKGHNYGWNAREGLHSFMKNKAEDTTSDPVYEYGRRQGGSITGGYVYRGSLLPELSGKYIFADYLSRRIWALAPPTEESKKHTATKIAKESPLAISSFGETPNGEILACGFESPYARVGKIYQLVPLATASSSTD